MDLEYRTEKETRLKNFLISKGLSKRAVNKLINGGGIYINGKEYDGNYNLSSGDKVAISFTEETTVEPVYKPIRVVFEDEYFLVVDKPKGLVTIPSKLHYEDSLAGRVKAYYVKCKEKSGIHPVNRLDLLTRGLVVFAKTGYVHSVMADVKITKLYSFTVNGILDQKEGVIDKPIERVNGTVKRQTGEGGKRSLTKYKVLSEKGDSSMIEAELLTGRTHQIRVHFALIGHALKGDWLYGDGEGEFDLCAYKISFVFPKNQKKYEFVLKAEK